MTPADNSHHLAAATARRSAEARRRSENALLALRGSGQPASVSQLVKDAGVARSWLYTQPDLIAGIRQLAGEAPTPRSAPASERPSTSVLPQHRDGTNGSNSESTSSPNRTTNNANKLERAYAVLRTGSLAGSRRPVAPELRRPVFRSRRNRSRRNRSR